MTQSNTVSRISAGSPDALGVTVNGTGLNVAVFSAHAERIEFCVFDETGVTEIERITLPERTGDVFHGRVEGLGIGTRYGFRAYGPYDPHGGHRFNPAKLLLDPYARAIDRSFALDPALFGFEPGTGRPSEIDSAAAMPKAVVVEPEVVTAPWSGAVPWSAMVVAEVHLRGLTMQHPGVPEEQRGTFAALATPVIIEHFKSLGITTLELMPAMAGLDERHLKPLGLRNYWNYNPIGLLAPEPRLAPGGWAEVKAATAALNAAGIEVILDVVYNHSGESDAEGPTVSLRGLDNASYYRLDPSDPARYVDDAGCGNILACDRPHVVRLVMDSLRAWAQFGGINGFRFDLATTLGRRASGFEAAAPLLAAIEQDPVLAPLRMIAEPWDIGPGGYQVGAFSARWGEWNDKYRDDVRRFWRGDGSIGDFAARLSGSADRFWSKRRPSRSVNYVTAHDGFTLADLVSYQSKHNEANGEGNRDGTNENYSWNNGVEGATDDPAILKSRQRDQANFLATLLLSRGTPMLGPGSELGASQSGNNNAYAQDNTRSWIDWAGADVELPGVVAQLTALRAANPSLTWDRFLEGRDIEGLGEPDVLWTLADGRAPGPSDWHDGRQQTLVATRVAPAQPGSEDTNRTAAVFHAGRSDVELHLPPTTAGRQWRLAFQSGRSSEAAATAIHAGGETLTLPARTVMLFVEEPEPGTSRRSFVAPELLDRLSRAAGIAAEWTEISGQRHLVSPDTKRALLGAMGLPVSSSGEARDRLGEIVELRQGRVLPRTLAARQGHAVSVRLAAQPGRSLPKALILQQEDGSQTTIAVNSDTPIRREVAPDGRAYTVRDLVLPPQAIGRHTLSVDGRPELQCALTVAPERSYLPGSLQAGGKLFGLAAHVYTMRDGRDAGIGDFSTLAEFGEASARRGASLVSINPLHMLFPLNRERASPYHPSDRRFLDPIYIDVSDLQILGEAPEVQSVFDKLVPVFATLRERALVEYPAVWAAKLGVLEAAHQAFSRRSGDAADLRDFDAFVSQGGEALQRFAAFQAISEAFPDRDWMNWPQELHSPANAAVATFAAGHAQRVGFHLYLQWLCDRQFGAAAARVKAAGLSIGIYGDLAVGTAPDGAEAWADQSSYCRGVSVGSPPDPFSATGQIWCLPPTNPLARDRFGTSPLPGLLRANMKHAGALRIDHAMGLSRLFWVPDGAKGSEGAYVGYDFEANLTDVALESHRAECLIVGEDLGTVQDGFRDAMERNAILSYRVLFFEREGSRFKAASQYPRTAMACAATHDIAPIPGWWKGADIDERQRVGQTDEASAARAREERRLERTQLAETIGLPGPQGEPSAEAVVAAAHRFLAGTDSMLVVAQADDLAGLTDGVNLPGTDRERSNWRRRLPLAAEDLLREAEAQGTLPAR